MKTKVLNNLLGRLLQVEKYFRSKEHKKIVEQLWCLYTEGKFDLCEKQLTSFPTEAQLLSRLVEKLQGKSIYKTLKLIEKGKVGNNMLVAKGLSSLLNACYYRM
jgi:hypothetical protein